MIPRWVANFKIRNGMPFPRRSPETAARLEGGAHKLAPQEWNAKEGEPWLIELIAPFGAQDEILRDLAQNVFRGRSFRIHMTGADGVRRVISSNDLQHSKPN